MSALHLLWQGAAVVVGGGILGLVYKGFDRKLAARMQSRIGPPLRQPFLDVGKLLVKESVVPKDAVGWLFRAMPFLAVVASFTVLLYLPWGPFPAILSGHGDAILVLYLLALAMALGGFASGSPLATVGAQREIVMLMSYEFPLAVAVVGVVWRLATLGGGPAFSLAAIAAVPLWTQVGPLGVIGLAILAACLLIVTPAELSKIPFDIPGGLMVEYSGTYLALFYLADAAKTIAMAALVVTLFAPYGIAGLLGLSGAGAQAVDLAFHLVKIFAVMFTAVTTVRVAMARLKVDQVARGFWLQITAVAVAGLVLLVLDRMVMG